MKSKAFLNKAMAIMTAVMVAIQPATALAEEQTQNPTEASTKVKYEGIEGYFSVVVPTKIELNSEGKTSFNMKVEGELDGWLANTYDENIKILALEFDIYSIDGKGVLPGCYLNQEGKEPIFAEFHEEVNTIYLENYMKKKGIQNYKDALGFYTFFRIFNPLPTWARNLKVEQLEDEEYRYLYAGMEPEQFSNCYFGYDMGTEVPITVNLEGNKSVPAGEWEGEIVIDIISYDVVDVPIDVCPEAQDAYDELVANGQLY